jgi:hypothetical protein
MHALAAMLQQQAGVLLLHLCAFHDMHAILGTTVLKPTFATF